MQKAFYAGAPTAAAGPAFRGASPSPAGRDRLLLDCIYDAVLLTTFSGRIVDVNPRAVEFLMFERDELCGMSILDVVAGADSKLLASIVESLAERRYVLVSAPCTRKDGSRFPAEVAISSMVAGGRQELCCSIRDLTVRKQAEQALKEALERLEERDRARLLLVSNVSHELRTPVTSMTYGISNLLKGVAGPVPDSIRPYLERFQRDSRRLLITASEILDLQTIEARTIKISRRKTPLGRLLAHSVDALSLHASHKGLELVSYPAAGHVFVDCDPIKMDRVFQNIIGNAIKYTPGGGRIEVMVERDAGRYNAVLVKVADTGIGIPAHALRNVMERYYRVGTQAEGAGLGLSIAREIVDMHGGKIDIQSPPPGKASGTQVSVSLQTTTAPTCLVASKDPATAEEVSRHLSSCGYVVETVSTAAAIFERIEQKKADALLIDVGLDDSDGLTVITKMRADEAVRKVPVLVVTRETPDTAVREILRGLSVRLFAAAWTGEDLLDALDEAVASTGGSE